MTEEKVEKIPLGQKPKQENPMGKVSEVTMEELRSITTEDDRKEQLNMIGEFVVQIYQQWTQFQLPKIKRATDDHPFPLRMAEVMSLTSAFFWMFAQKNWEFECQMYGRKSPWDNNDPTLTTLRMQVINAVGSNELTMDQLRSLALFVNQLTPKPAPVKQEEKSEVKLAEGTEAL